MVCKGENPETSGWRGRIVEARLSGTNWKQYSCGTELRTSCDDPVDSREKALDLLVVAGGGCLDKALDAVARYSKEDLAAAYLTRFERNGDPVDLLSALKTAKGFNRALALERLRLTREAIVAWDEAAKEDSEWSTEAGEHRDRLQRLPDPARDLDQELGNALQQRDTAALTRIAQAFPADAARYFEKSDLREREGARLLATAIAATGERFPQAVVDAMERPKDARALEEGLAALRRQRPDFPRAVRLLERAGNPLHLAMRYYAANFGGPRSMLDAAIPQLKPEYRELSSRIYMTRADLLERDDRYLDAHAAYKKALEAARNDPTTTAATLVRRSANYTTIGDAEAAFHDAYGAMSLLDRVVDTNTRHQAYGAAAMAARELGYPRVELDYRNAAVEDIQRAVLAASDNEMAGAKVELAVALRARAETHLEQGRDDEATGDLQQAFELAEAAEDPRTRELLRMRVREVRGQTLLKTNPAAAQAAFSEAIELAKNEDSTYRATLHFQRATARRNAGDPHADADIDEAVALLRDEVRKALAKKPKEASEPLWTPYFSRFREKHDEIIESRIDAGDEEGSFVQDELALAFEPMQILLQSGSVPPGYRPIETVADLTQARANLPADTVILQFLVLPDRTFIWVVTRERIDLVPSRVTREKINGWVTNALAALAAGQQDPLTRVTRAAYSELFSEPLKRAGASKTRIVIVPDEPMQGLPFNALGTSEGYLIERASITTAGSTSLYLHALARNRQLATDHTSSVLLIGSPTFTGLARLGHVEEEVEELSRVYSAGATTLIGPAATVQRFLPEARNAAVIHFAGHALATPQDPWQSRLLFAPGPQNESGELTAQALMQQLPNLAHTRLVVLGACSTAGGSSVGPQGLAPLVRPFIAANVPAVVGTLWDVKDASAKDLLVSFHCHYRHGDDVAVALRQAQLERLRKNDPASKWAAFQVVGYAASPYARSIALEDPNIEHLCTQNSLLGPDGLHPQ
jgi:CHAT domain-containing protein